MRRVQTFERSFKEIVVKTINFRKLRELFFIKMKLMIFFRKKIIFKHL